MAKPGDRKTLKRNAANEQSLQQAVQLHQQGHLDEAEAIYRKILRGDPPNHRVLNLVGLAAFQRRQFEIAIRYLTRAATISPRIAKYHYDLGVVEQARGAPEESVRHYEDALRLDSTLAAGWENLGVAHFDQGRNLAAVEAFERALALNGDSLLSLSNLATLRRWHGQHADALALLERGLAIDPLNADLRMKRAETLLATGDFARGWEDYAWRFVNASEWGARATACVPVPKWAGEPLRQKQVLVHAEQGIGDEVMFASCLSEIAQTDARVTLLSSGAILPIACSSRDPSRRAAP